MKKGKKKKDREKDGIARAREGVRRAGLKLADRLARLESVADGIEAEAVARFSSAAVGELVERRLLRDLSDLHAAFASREAGLPDDLAPFRHLPEALLRWTQSRFGLSAYLEAGKVLQVPADRVGGFTVEGEPPAVSPGAIVRMKVIAPGWKRGSEIIVAPTAQVVP